MAWRRPGDKPLSEPMIVYRRIYASLGLNELKASGQISALQRLTGLLDLPSKMAIYSSVIFSNLNHCPLGWFFSSRACITKMQKLQERPLRFALKDIISDNETLLSKAGVDSF